MKRPGQDTATPCFTPSLPIASEGQKCVEEYLSFSMLLLVFVLNLLSVFLSDSKPSRIKNQDGLSGAGNLPSQADLQPHGLFTN